MLDDQPSQTAVSLALERPHDQNQPQTPTPAPGMLSPRSRHWGLTLNHVDKELYSQAAGVSSFLFALLLSLSLSLVTVKRHRGCDCHLCRQSVRLPKPISSFLCIIYPEPLLLPLPVCLLLHRMEPSRAEREQWGLEREAQERWDLGSLSLCGTQTRERPVFLETPSNSTLSLHSRGEAWRRPCSIHKDHWNAA